MVIIPPKNLGKLAPAANPFNNEKHTSELKAKIPGGITFTGPSSLLGVEASVPQVKTSKRTIWLLAILGAMSLFFYLIWSGTINISILFGAPPQSSEGVQFSAEEVRLLNIKKLPIDDIVESPVFKSLRRHGNLPVVPDNLGRSNPFIPF